MAAEKIDLTYHGGLAEHGRIHFYEYSRASYGFARLLNTAEHFRRTGRVVQKIGSKNYVDLIVEAPKQGSFVTEVLVPVIAGTLPELSGVSARAMLAYIFQLLTPRSEETDETVINLAEIRAQELRRDREEREESVRIAKLESIIETQTATAREALALVRYALRTKNAAVGRLDLNVARFEEMKLELETELEQEKEIKKVDKWLAVLDPRSVARLSSRVRPMVSEMGLPLRRKDIRDFTIGAANENKPIAFFNAARVAAIESKTVEDEPVRIEARIHGYDRDAGVGKVSSDQFTRKLKFIMPPERRAEVQPKVLRGMHDNVDTVILEVLRVLDKSNQPTSLILFDVQFIDSGEYDLDVDDAD